ncbi:MAG: hypothetical protein LBV38_05665 [Alistipes sp.]|jgi:hypothetical protein|nr:hypothetical protein [Alistipes sp.]
MMNLKSFLRPILTVLLCALLFFAGRCSRNGGGGFSYAETETRTQTITQTQTDTIIIRDTLRETTFVPVTRHITRVDTVFLPIRGDTASGDTIRNDVLEKSPPAFRLPIEQKTYTTANYRAVVEGFRPSLIELEIYRATPKITTTTNITREIRTPLPRGEPKSGQPRSGPPPRWGLGIQTGWGVTPQGPTPYIGVGVQYNVITW